MGVSNVTPEMINFQLQNMKVQLEMISLNTQNIFMLPIILPMSGMEIINLGIQVLKICLELSNMEMEMNNEYNYILQIHNIWYQIQNLGLKLQNYSPNFNTYVQRQNYIQKSNDFMNNENMINIQNDTNNNNNYLSKQKSIIFKSRFWDITTLTFPYSTTVDKVLQKYFDKNPNLEKNNTLFVFNSRAINKDDKTKIEEFFYKVDIPKVLVLTDNLKGG